VSRSCFCLVWLHAICPGIARSDSCCFRGLAAATCVIDYVALRCCRHTELVVSLNADLVKLLTDGVLIEDYVLDNVRKLLQHVRRSVSAVVLLLLRSHLIAPCLTFGISPGF
jgi:hypothetical protein